MEQPTAASEKSIRQSQGVCAGEQEYIQQRTQIVLDSLTSLGIKCSADSVPRIALLASGGGQRAAVGVVGSLYQLVKDGLLDSVLFLGGISGSTWAMSSLYSDPHWSVGIDEAVSKLIHTDVEPDQVVDWLVKRAEDENFSLTDIWGLLTSAGLMKQMEERRLSEEANRKPTNPYPIYCTVEKYAVSDGPTEERWFEFSPHEAGFTELGLFIETSLLGSKFKAGQLLEKKPEMDMIKLQGFCGSAVADMDTNTEYIIHWLESSVVSIAKKVYLQVYGVLHKIVAVVSGWFKDLLSHLETLKNRLMDTDKKHFSDSLLQANSMTDEEKHSLFQQLSANLMEVVVTWREDLPEGHQKNIVTFLIDRVFPLIVKWEWGTIDNFLYMYPNSSVSPFIYNQENLHLEDAGLMMNVPYPPFLGDKRDIDLIIALDYSAYNTEDTSSGGAFETVMKARDYAAQLNKPFPVINDKIPEERKFPMECYVFEGKHKEPTIIHMPLFNRQNCKDEKELENRMAEFSTFHPTSDKDKIKFLFNTTRENVERNKETLLREMNKAAVRRHHRKPAMKRFSESCLFGLV